MPVMPTPSGAIVMHGVDPYAYMQQVATRLHELNSRSDIEPVLDELEYLFEVIPPELQDNAEKLIGLLREKLTHASRASSGE